MKPETSQPCGLFFLAAIGSLLVGNVAAGVSLEDPGLHMIHGTPPLEAGGGELRAPVRDELSAEERESIWADLNASLAKLRAEGRLLAAESFRGAHPSLDWPLRAASGLADPGYWGISNFVDLNSSFPNFLLDYNCGARTYDTTGGYNHQGIDFFTWPFSWYKMDFDQVEVVAAAAGQIIFKADGNFDRSCSFGGSWNAVYVQHADGSIIWYGHMKRGSLTTKPVGAAVAQGEYLGVVGSSGSSTGPHLHMEVYDSVSQLNEPYDGTCNNLNPGDSWWASQRPYYDSAVNRVQTGFAAANFPACPLQESPNDSFSFTPGQTIYFTTFYRDQLISQTSQYRLYRPDGVLHASWNHNSNAAHYAASWWWWSRNDLMVEGLWRFEVTFEGRTHTHRFAVGAIPPSGEALDLRLAKPGGGLARLTWAASCITTDTDFEVYEGTLGVWYDHGWIACTTDEAAQYDVGLAGGDAYFLVVPTNTFVEGHYGFDSLPAAPLPSPRPPGSPSCVTQSEVTCP